MKNAMNRGRSLAVSVALGVVVSACGGGGASGTASVVAAGGANPVLMVAETGSGTVVSTPPGIQCGSSCSAGFATGTGVTLSAAPASGYTFTGWSGACSGTGSCVVSMSSGQSVDASFTPVSTTQYNLTVTSTGSGAVTSSPAGIACGSTCSAPFVSGSNVTLTAQAASGYVFSGWSGACSGTSTCQVTMSAAQSVTANFVATAVTYPLTVTTSGAGTITSAPSGISCGSLCTSSFASGATVRLTAAPAAGYGFAGWGGACAGQSGTTCSLTMTQAYSASASFTSYTLSVTDTGSGTVTSSPAGISCGSVCTAPFAGASSVTLTAQAASGYVFSGWSGACSGTGNCVVAMTAAESVTASFVPATTTYPITVTASALGTITSNPSGLACGSTCSSSFASGAVVTLTATPASGYTFSSWGGACAGQSGTTCSLTMTQAYSVSANYTAATSSNHYATMADASLGAIAGTNGDIPFPADNAWNTDISDTTAYPVDPNSAALITHIGASTGLHMDFGTSAQLYGIPYVIVDSTQPLVNISVNSSTGYPADSDVFPMPIPANAPIEGGANYASGGGDGHVLVISRSPVTGLVQQLFELWHAQPQSNGSWTADGSAAFDLTSDNVRPSKTGQCDVSSADAAGLPIFPGLLRYDEVASGAIHHALRFTVASSRAAFVPPANHWASTSTATNFPPMGMRVRLKASYVIPSTFSKESQVILQAMKTYGMIVADNGSNWFVTGTQDDRWANLALFSEMATVQGSDFEVIQMTGLKTSCP
jgi:hypothetical protein